WRLVDENARALGVEDMRAWCDRMEGSYGSIGAFQHLRNVAHEVARARGSEVLIRDECRKVGRMARHDSLLLARVADRLTRRLSLSTARRAFELLGRARVAIGQATGLLSAGIRNAEWWTYLYTLRAHLAFEILELEQHARDLDKWNSGIDPSEILLDALRAIRAGFDNSPQDHARRKQLARIWYALYRCYTSHVGGEAEASWTHQNSRAGLQGHMVFLRSRRAATDSARS